MANAPYYTKTQVDAKIDPLTVDIENLEQNLDTLNQDVYNLQLEVDGIADGTGGKGYATISDAMSVTPLPADGVLFTIDYDNEAERGVYRYDSTVTPEGYVFVRPIDAAGVVEEGDLRAVSGDVVFRHTEPLINMLEYFQNKNLIDPSKIDFTKRFSPGTLEIVARGGTAILGSGYIPVEEGKTYVWSVRDFEGAMTYQGGGYCTSEGQTSGLTAISFTTTTNGRRFTVPTGQGITHVYLNLAATSTSSNDLNGLVQLWEGTTIIDYEPFGYTQEIKEEYLPKDILESIEGILESVSDLEVEVERLSPVLVDKPKKNLVNPSNIDFTKRFSPGTLEIVARGGTRYVGSGYIPVKEGEWYILSFQNIVGVLGYSGGYCTSDGQLAGLSEITFVNPVGGVGKCFQVPLGQGITHVYLNLLTTTTSSNELDGDQQLELGEQATEYEVYELITVINEEMLPSDWGGGSTPSNEDAYSKYTTFGNLSYNGSSDKISNFRKHWIKKDKDLVVVNTGTSLTARTTEHCTEHQRANERPPLMHSNNFASHIWDKIKWEGQLYRRFDYLNFFTETGSWQTQSNIDGWDDGPYRSGLTRYSDGNSAGIAFLIPEDAWQFNFIYRTDQVSTENAVISIGEGNGKVQVYDEINEEWVEANGFGFSQKESPEVVLPSITNINAETGANQNLTNYQVKGNTTYQKRLKMRCKWDVGDSRDEEKTVSISTTSGRLSYWGVEWSVREFMITYINAARGSHSSSVISSVSLCKFQDNEIWSFKPDLLLTEDPIHNAGGAGNLVTTRPKEWFERVTDNFFFNPNNSVSIVASANRHSLPVPEMVIFNSSIAWNFNGIDDNGNLIIYELPNAQWTALDAQMSCWEYVTETYPDVIYINAVKNWVEAAFSIHGNLKVATQGSGKSGKTFTNEGSHWNDTGCKIMARVVLPVLDFIL